MRCVVWGHPCLQFGARSAPPEATSAAAAAAGAWAPHRMDQVPGISAAGDDMDKLEAHPGKDWEESRCCMSGRRAGAAWSAAWSAALPR